MKFDGLTTSFAGLLFPIRHLRNRKHLQRREGAGGGVHFQGHGAEQPLPHRIAAHRPREVGRIGGGERLVEEPGRLPVGFQSSESRQASNINFGKAFYIGNAVCSVYRSMA